MKSSEEKAKHITKSDKFGYSIMCSLKLLLQLLILFLHSMYRKFGKYLTLAAFGEISIALITFRAVA
jgi:hypothetical protein